MYVEEVKVGDHHITTPISDSVERGVKAGDIHFRAVVSLESKLQVREYLSRLRSFLEAVDDNTADKKFDRVEQRNGPEVVYRIGALEQVLNQQCHRSLFEELGLL